MIPVDQSRTGKPHGNCMAAAIASVLEIPLASVDFRCESFETDWHEKRDAALARIGLALVELPLDPEHLRLWDDLYPGGHFLVGVTNPDGIKHVVVWHRGRIVHDPNPDRACMDAKPDAIMLLFPIGRLADVGLRVAA